MSATGPAPDSVYHLELRQFPHVARVFNLERDELMTRFIGPWAAGAIIEHDDRRWPPERARLIILEGPELRTEQLGLGRGWATASRTCTDVTAALLGQARRGAAARPELEALKTAVEEVAAVPVSLGDVMALAVAAHPQWRPSEQLALAEQAVWELLHQERVRMSRAGTPVAAEDWPVMLLDWASWAGSGSDAIRLHTSGGTA